VSPIFSGTRSRKRSHCGRPHSDFFQAKKAQDRPPTIAMHRYQRVVRRPDMPTVNLVSAGSSPPVSLKILANTGTMNATRASITTMAKLMTTAG
jgi:hypothetical protein